MFTKIVSAFALILAFGFAHAQNVGSQYVLCQSAVAVSAPADTNENILYTCTVPASAMGTNGRLRFSYVYTFTNSANNKTIRIRFGGIGGTAYYNLASTTTSLLSGCGEIANRNAANSQISKTSSTQANCNTGAISGSVVTSSVDTSSSTTLVFTCQKASAGETCTIENVVVELLYGV